MKIIVIVMLLAVVVSLFSGLYFLYKDKGNSHRVVNALTVRVALSLGVFFFLMISYYFGFFPTK